MFSGFKEFFIFMKTFFSFYLLKQKQVAIMSNKSNISNMNKNNFEIEKTLFIFSSLQFFVNGIIQWIKNGGIKHTSFEFKILQPIKR